MKTDLRGLLPHEVEDLVVSLGEKKFRAKQLFSWVNKGVTSFDAMGNIPKTLREKLSGVALVDNMEVVDVQTSKDGTEKLLLKLIDGHMIEAVLMRYKHGVSVCISTQVGCRMGCTFCASTIGGMVRNVTAGELMGQIHLLGQRAGDRVSNIVLMGSGEPLENLDEVLKFLEIVNHDQGLHVSMRHITLSTCGLIPEIKALADKKLQLTLAVSLHASDDQTRSQLMPVNKKYNIQALLEACRYYTDQTGRRVTFEYALIKGKNDGVQEAEKLGRLLKGLLCHVNLIPINPVKERGYDASSDGAIRTFQKKLKDMGIEATVRRELGSDINAACGQLRKKHQDEMEPMA